MLWLWPWLIWWIYGGCVGLFMLTVLIDACLGLPTIADLTRAEFDRSPPAPAPRLSVVVPALNEQEAIEACLRSLAAQDYADLEIIAVNDRSTDRTGQLMDECATAAGRIRVLHITELPAGWLGKTHAMHSAAAIATGEWLLFTDGDILFRADCLRRALAYAEAMRADHLTILPTMRFHSLGERMMLALFQLSVTTARPWKVPDPKSRAHAGAGAFNMVRRSAYNAIGGFAALRMEVVEDLALARRVKQGGLASRSALGPGLVSVHWARGVLGIVRTLTKNFYALLGFRWYLALAAVAAVLVINVAPFILVWLAPGWSKLGFAVCLAAIFGLYVRLYPLNRISPALFLLHPVAALLGAYTLLRSAALTTFHDGVVWRGTRYPLAELRRAQAEKPGR